jgi:hypothetical protein
MGNIWILVANDLFEGGLNQSFNIDYKKETRLFKVEFIGQETYSLCWKLCKIGDGKLN